MRSPLCDLVGIDVPIIQAGMAIFTSPALAAAVSDAGALGSLGAWNRPTDQLRRDLAELHDRTDRPFAVNHVVPALDADAFAATLDRPPAVVSFALDDAGDHMRRVHDAGSLVMQQVTTVQQARAGRGARRRHHRRPGRRGRGLRRRREHLEPRPAGGGRRAPAPGGGRGRHRRRPGIAAVMVLGAAGVNLGSRFLASVESPVGERWKKELVTPPVGGLGAVRLHQRAQPEPRDRRLPDPRAAPTNRLRAALGGAHRRGGGRPDAGAGRARRGRRRRRPRALLVVGGQSAGLIEQVEPAGDIVRALVAEAREVLQWAVDVDLWVLRGGAGLSPARHQPNWGRSSQRSVVISSDATRTTTQVCSVSETVSCSDEVSPSSPCRLSVRLAGDRS